MSEPSSKNTVETTDIFDKLFEPEIVNSLFDPYEEAELVIQVFSEKDTIEDTITLSSVYPFFTIEDLKVEIYIWLTLVIT